MATTFPKMEMSNIILDENNLRNLPPRERLKKCAYILENEKDESLRWDAVWLAGEIAEVAGPDEPIFDEVADLMSLVLQNDGNGVVKHEACFQIAARNMRKKIPDLINSALNDKSTLVKHEALEALGLMRAYDSAEQLKKAVSDQNADVRETANFVLKRFTRLKNIKTDYIPSNIL